MTLSFEQQLRAAKLPMPVAEFRFHPTRKWRFDFAYQEQRIGIEIDGGTWIQGRHSRGAGYERDLEKLNAALELGWRVARFTTAMVKDGRALATVERLLKKGGHAR